jgi:hypothetical protein
MRAPLARRWRFQKGICSIPAFCQTFHMRNLTATICLTIAVLFGSAGVSWSQDFQKGLAAAHSGDFATALREFTPLAEQGDASAQYYLGLMYDNGQGVLNSKCRMICSFETGGTHAFLAQE